MCLASQLLNWPSAIPLVAALAYGLLTGRQTWTLEAHTVHAHTLLSRSQLHAFDARTSCRMHCVRRRWTHAHNGVHNPQAIPRPMRHLMAVDFVGVVDAWMME